MDAISLIVRGSGVVRIADGVFTVVIAANCTQYVHPSSERDELI